MMATSRKIMPDDEPGEIEALLPWYAAGTLDARDAHRVEDALARDPGLARQFAVIQDEYAETIHLNESLGAPSGLAMQKLFAAIDAEPARKLAAAPAPGWSERFGNFFARLSPRTLAWSASVGAVLLLLQAGIIGRIMMEQTGGTFGTASYQEAPAPKMPAQEAAPPPAAAPAARMRHSAAPRTTTTRSLAPARDAVLFVRFKPDARIVDVTALLARYQAAVVGGSGDLFRIRLAGRTDAEASSVLARLQKESIVAMAVPAQ